MPAHWSADGIRPVDRGQPDRNLKKTHWKSTQEAFSGVVRPCQEMSDAVINLRVSAHKIDVLPTRPP